MDDFIMRLFELNKENQKMLLINFENQLKIHDWFYNFSDDPRRVREGKKISKMLRENFKSLAQMGLGEYADKLVDKYAPRSEDLSKPLYKTKKKE